MISPLIIAHRGIHHHHPENSLPAVQAAVSSGFGVEFDVRFLGNGDIVVHHDADLLRSCGQSVALSSIASFETLAGFELLNHEGQPSGVGIPLLSEVLSEIPVECDVRLEVKIDSIGPSVIPLVRKLLREVGDDRNNNLVFISFNPQVVRLISKWSNYKTKYIVGSNSDAHLPRWKHLALFSPIARWYANADGLSVDWEIVSWFAGRGDLECWTVDSADSLEAVLRAGVVAVTSNSPDLVQRVLGTLDVENSHE